MKLMPKQSVLGLSRSANPYILEIIFARPIDSDELINTWLYLKGFSPNQLRPEGWESCDKNPDNWEPSGEIR